MDVRSAFASILLVTSLCVAPAFATGGNSGNGHIGHVFITPVACDNEAEIYQEGAFTQWVRVPGTHFTALKVGMTNPDDGFDDTVGIRLDGGTQGVPFAPANTFSITFVPTGEINSSYGMVFNLPGFGLLFLGSGGGINGVTTRDNGDGSFTAVGNFASFNFPTGTTFVGLYQNCFDGRASFTNTIIDARVNGVVASPNMHTGGKATNGFVADCNGFFGES